jgi:hypothetical protein
MKSAFKRNSKFKAINKENGRRISSHHFKEVPLHERPGTMTINEKVNLIKNFRIEMSHSLICQEILDDYEDYLLSDQVKEPFFIDHDKIDLKLKDSDNLVIEEVNLCFIHLYKNTPETLPMQKIIFFQSLSNYAINYSNDPGIKLSFFELTLVDEDYFYKGYKSIRFKSYMEEKRFSLLNALFNDENLEISQNERHHLILKLLDPDNHDHKMQQFVLEKLDSFYNNMKQLDLSTYNKIKRQTKHYRGYEKKIYSKIFM